MSCGTIPRTLTPEATGPNEARRRLLTVRATVLYSVLTIRSTQPIGCRPGRRSPC